ncbi:MAG: 30S ribosomal protein S4 [Eubacteriaceae bacterium]|jgi:small subunit ribosomal protein S4|nr:30S ribosomal protein S4 [Eubacteriaceae bacterium]
MARYIDASCRLCRKEKEKLFLKGDRCYSAKCALDRRGTAPGQHGNRRTKVSEYGMQLREKQKARRFYGVLEKQFSNYFSLAEKQPGVTGENLLRILESRLDNVVYRLGFASSRKEARQLVLHGHFLVDGKKVNIPSFLVKESMNIAVKDTSKKSQKFKILAEAASGKILPKWLDADYEKMSGKVVALPTREDIGIEIKDNLIVEYYSK